MRASLRSRLFLNYLVVLSIGMGLAASLAWLAVERTYIAAQRENLLAQAKLIAAALQGADLPVEAAQPYYQVANVQPGIHSRIIAEQGAVVVGLPLAADGACVQAPLAENSGFVSPGELLQRPEIQQAMLGEAAAAVRRVSAAGGGRVLYAAAPIPAATGEITGIVYLATPLPPGGLPTRLLWQLAGAVLAAICLASAAGTLLARRLARPVEAVAHAARAVSAGDLGQRVPVESDIHELDSLGQAFNAMTASLQQSDQAKNAFIADVTHELRTPLTVIKGAIETLEDGALDDLAGRGPLLASMQRETDRLIRLVNDLLVLARADAGALKLELRALDLGELARSRCEHLDGLAAQRRVELRVDEGLNPAPRRVFGDADRLAQVLDNLLDNAVRHSPEGSTVTIAIQQSGDEVLCAVSDQGDGIPAEHLPFIFERFYRVDASRNRQTGGAGLGLAIARALVLAQGGRIDAQSAPGRGTVISFRLPLDEDCHPIA
ncbi:MAG: HAMP domain-containing protein [Anaerolineales bacterium]|nr:HAMP domain-containing protein [Anaerolineales bacterium]